MLSDKDLREMRRLPEYQDVQAFASWKHDDESPVYEARDLVYFNWLYQLPVHEIHARLEALGLTFKPRPTERAFAGFSRNPHTRWEECPSHGGSGAANFGTKAVVHTNPASCR